MPGELDEGADDEYWLEVEMEVTDMPNEQHATSKPAKKFSLPPPPDASPKPYLKMQK